MIDPHRLGLALFAIWALVALTVFVIYGRKTSLLWREGIRGEALLLALGITLTAFGAGVVRMWFTTRNAVAQWGDPWLAKAMQMSTGADWAAWAIAAASVTVIAGLSLHLHAHWRSHGHPHRWRWLVASYATAIIVGLMLP